MMKIALFQERWNFRGCSFNKISIKWCVCLFSFFFVSFDAYNKDIRLTRFTKDLISLYIDQTMESTGHGNIVIDCIEDSIHYYVRLFEDSYINIKQYINNPLLYKGHNVILSGASLPILFSKHITDKFSLSIEEHEINYDPIIWQVAFHKDYTLCKMFTYKSNPEDDISDIIKLAKKSLNGSEIIPYDTDYIYDNIQVDHPARFAAGDEELYEKIKSQIHFKDEYTGPNVPVIINMVINQDGDASILGFFKESKNPTINRQSMEAAKVISNYKFIPATHRGERVQVFLPLYFVKSFFIQQ